MKKFILSILVTAWLLALLPLSASSAALTEEQQTAILCGYSRVIFEAYYDDQKTTEYYQYCDIDKDGTDELILKTLENDNDRFQVYGWRNGEVRLLDSFPGDRHCWLYAPSGENGLLCVTQFKMHERVRQISLSNGTISDRFLYDKTVKDGYDYSFFYGRLNSYPVSSFVFPSDLTALQRKYTAQMQKAGGSFPYATDSLRFYFPDVNGDGKQDLIVACHDVYNRYTGKYEYGPGATYRLYLYDNDSFRDCGTFAGEYARFAYADYNPGIVMEGTFNGSITCLTVSGGRICTEMIDGNWDQRYGGKKQIPGLMYVSRIIYPPDAPSGMQAVLQDGSSVRVSWNKTGNAVGVWQYNPEYKQFDCVAVTHDSFFIVSGLEPGDYYFCVNSVTDTDLLTESKGRVIVNGVHSLFTVPVRVTVSSRNAYAYHPGDVDGNGVITSSDARLALRASVGLEKEIVKGSFAWLACDADGDGRITSSDARLILRAGVGLEDPASFGKKSS